MGARREEAHGTPAKELNPRASSRLAPADLTSPSLAQELCEVAGSGYFAAGSRPKKRDRKARAQASGRRARDPGRAPARAEAMRF